MGQVTPWEVSGAVDYEKLIKDFGVAKIDKKMLGQLEKHTGSLHHLLRRGIFFAHRDLDLALKHYEQKNLFLYTGCGPSGPVHLGHITVWNFVKWLQDVLDLELWFQFTDDEKFLFKDLSYEEVQGWLQENMLDVIALGFNPKKTHFLIDTRHANLLYPEAIKVAKRITFSTAKATFGFSNENNIGTIFYASMQAVPAFLPSVLAKKELFCLIPHAIDQDPIFRVTRDVLPKLGHYKPASIQGMFLPGLGGMAEEGKMSSSKGDAIRLGEGPKEVRRKIHKYAFSGGQPTVEEHRTKGGNPDIDTAYQWLRFFEEDDGKLKRIYQDYRSGRLLSGELKDILVEKINTLLAEYQERRKKAGKLLPSFVYKQ